MGKFLVVLSVILTAASAVLGYLNQTRLQETRKSLEETETAANQAKTQLAKAQGDLKSTSQSLSAAVTEKDQLTSRLSLAQGELERAKSQANTLSNDKATLESQVTQLTKDLETRTQELEQKGSGDGQAAPASTADQQAQLAEQQTLIAKLQGDLDSARSQLSTLSKKEQDRAQQRIRHGLQGRILAVNPAWNFVVLNLGDKNGVVNNAELLVKRGSQFIGKVRVTSVERATSIADIVANSVPQGTTISPGDDVIYQASRE